MKAIRSFLAAAQHADTCPEKTDAAACCGCGLWDARSELDNLGIRYRASYYDTHDDESSVDALAELAAKRYRGRSAPHPFLQNGRRPELIARVEFDLSDAEWAEFETAFARYHAAFAREIKLSDLQRQLVALQADRERLFLVGISCMDANIARIETEIAALKAVS